MFNDDSVWSRFLHLSDDTPNSRKRPETAEDHHDKAMELLYTADVNPGRVQTAMVTAALVHEFAALRATVAEDMAPTAAAEPVPAERIAELGKALAAARAGSDIAAAAEVLAGLDWSASGRVRDVADEVERIERRNADRVNAPDPVYGVYRKR